MADVTVLTQTGEEWIVDTIDAAADEPHHIQWGTGATTAAKGETGVSTPAAEARTTGTVTQPSADVYQVVGVVTCASAGKTITNAGCYTDATTGTCVILGSFTGIVLSVADAIQFTFQLEVA